MRKKKIVLNTNAPWLHTGLAENGGYLAKYLFKTGKYDLVYYCSQVSVLDGNHAKMPWKSRGCIPADQGVIQRANQDPGFARWMAYGGLLINDVIKDEKPDIFWGSDDIWTFSADFYKSNWWKQISSFLHITVDSVPVIEQAYEQAKETFHFYTWAKFAGKEMKKRGPEFAHVGQIYGATDINNFSPLSEKERADLRRRFGINTKSTIIGYTFRNQLRKEALNILMAFKAFKDENPNADVKIHLHTSFSESGGGWDFPRLIKWLGINPSDVLATYVCRNCGTWHVAPYAGEDLDCKVCGAKKSLITPTIAHGVPDDEMKFIYGIRDATVSPLTSGGLEYENVNTLLCGLPLATTNYSSGEDFCELPFVSTIEWFPRFEAGTSFMKATNSVPSIKSFIEKVWKMSDKERRSIGEQSREWAAKTFSAETVGAQWEAAFDAVPFRDWSSITLTPKPKNDKYPMPDIADDGAWIKALYNNILLVEPDPEGFKHWLMQLERKTPRQAIYDCFINIAREDNAKNSPPQDFGVLFDKNDRERVLFVLKESGGDIFIATSLFKGLKELYPNADLYVASDPKFHDLLAGNEYVHKVLPYIPIMENEMIMKEYVNYYYFPALATQRQLNYLTHDKIQLELK